MIPTIPTVYTVDMVSTVAMVTMVTAHITIDWDQSVLGCFVEHHGFLDDVLS